MIFNIQKFCVNDGPGIRTTVFFKGCPLRCLWCHNPESHSFKKELSLDVSKCTLCGTCEKLCPNGCHRLTDGQHLFYRDRCVSCGKCTESYCGNLEIIGKEESADDIIAEVLQDRDFYATSGGGLTLSGGEPMSDPEFAYELLSKAKQNGIGTCMETCGFAPLEKYLRIRELVDIFLWDVKETDPEKHMEFTGVSNELILNNLRVLDGLGSVFVLRCPIIPGYNDRDDHFRGIADLASSLSNVQRIEVEPYHPLGEKKLPKLGKENVLHIPFPSKETVESWISQIQSFTDIPVSRG